MPKRTVTATAPDGTVLTRQTARAYTYAVLTATSKKYLLGVAEDSLTTLRGHQQYYQDMTPDHSQWSCRDHNLALTNRRLVQAQQVLVRAQREFAADPTGVVWGAHSFHGSPVLADRESAKVRDWAHLYGVIEIRVVPVD